MLSSFKDGQAILFMAKKVRIKIASPNLALSQQRTLLSNSKVSVAARQTASIQRRQISLSDLTKELFGSPAINTRDEPSAELHVSEVVNTVDPNTLGPPQLSMRAWFDLAQAD